MLISMGTPVHAAYPMVQPRHCDRCCLLLNHVVMRYTHIMHPSSRSTGRARASHNTVREGVRLGLIIGAATWLWLAAFDLAVGEPFQTLHFLGGYAGFTLIHFALCLAYGLAIIGAVHGSMKEPTVMFALIFCAILFQAAFVGLTAMLDNVGLGQPAWGKFFFGNVMAAGLTYVLLARDHPMRDLYHTAEAHQKD